MAAGKSSETNWLKRLVAGKDDDNRKYMIWPYKREKSNTIPTSQLSMIISRRTYDQWHDHTHESAIPRTEGEVEKRLRVSTVETTSLLIEKSASTSIVIYTYNSSNLEEARRIAKTTKAIGKVSERRR